MKKLSNKILVIGLVVLIGAFAASRFFRSPGLESNLRKELLKLDTASISELRILPSKEHATELMLKRDGSSWKVVKGDRTEPGSKPTIKGMLSTLVNLQAQRMISRQKEKWQEYNVADSSTHVTAFQNGNKVADIHIGKLGFAPSSDGRFGGAFTYVRLNDEDEVYVVDGFLESSFNMGFNDWRDKTFLKVDQNAITKVSFHYPADSSFVIEKRDSLWYLGNQDIEPLNMEGVLSQFSSKFLNEFEDGFVPGSSADISIQVDGKAGTLAAVEFWKKDASEWVCTSSLQKGIYFSSKGSSIASDLFFGRKKLLAR